jgi:hypothetical protein
LLPQFEQKARNKHEAMLSMSNSLNKEYGLNTTVDNFGRLIWNGPLPADKIKLLLSKLSKAKALKAP